jgi:LAO/AO transport system kinase
MEHSVDALAAGLSAGNRRALAQAITLVERGGAPARALIGHIYAQAQAAHLIGVTGPPGVGKSTLVAALAQEWRRRGLTTAILAVDPSSPLSGGAVLGDRIRMQALGGDDGVFIRSMANRGRTGGLARATADAALLAAAAGFERIVIETVGAGQSETAIAGAAATTVVVDIPGTGDEVQSIKAGMLEIADIYVINKADQPNAAAAVRRLRAALQLVPPPADGRVAPVLATVAERAEGVTELVEAIEAHRVYRRQHPPSGPLRAAAMSNELAAACIEVLRDRLPEGLWQAAVQQLLTGGRDPYLAAEELLAQLDAAAGRNG